MNNVFDLELIPRLIVAAFLGCVIGLERRLTGQTAGDRTFALTLFLITSKRLLHIDPRIQERWATRPRSSSLRISAAAGNISRPCPTPRPSGWAWWASASVAA